MNTLALNAKQNKFTPTTNTTSLLVQRKCACGGASKLGGQCSACEKKNLVGGNVPLIQPKLKIGQPNDKYEQEADRVADEVMRMPEPNVQRQVQPGEEKKVIQKKPIASKITPLVQRQVSDEDDEEPIQLKSHASSGTIQRQEPDGKPKSNEDETKEALKKTGEAFLETAPGKAIVKKGKEVVTSLPGTVITGTAAVGAITTLIATNKALPIQAPAIPLDKLHPGLSMRITVEGPLRAPTKGMISFSGKLGLPKRQGRQKPVKTESEKLSEENARMQREQFEFRESLKTPEEKDRDNQRLVDQLSKRLVLPGLKSQKDVSTIEKKKEEATVQRKEINNSADVDADTSMVREVTQSAGQPLDANTRGFMEQRFGHDFSQVRIHADSPAAASARTLNARAYTLGQDIVFDSAQYSPSTRTGGLLLAHELTHTIQQSQSTTRFRDLTVQRKGPRRDKESQEDELRKSAWNPFFVHHDFKNGTEKERAIILESMTNENGGEFATRFKEFASKPDSVPHQIVQTDRDGPKPFWTNNKIKGRGFVFHHSLPAAKGARTEHWVHPNSTYLIFERFGLGSKKRDDNDPKPAACLDPAVDPENVFGPSLGCEETEGGPPDGFADGLACLYANRAIEFMPIGADEFEYYVLDTEFEGEYIQFPICGKEDLARPFNAVSFNISDASEIFPSLSEDEE